MPGEEILCDYGRSYHLPADTPPPPTPPTQSSQESIALTYASTGTLVDTTVARSPLLKRVRISQRAAPPVSPLTQSTVASSGSIVDLTVDYGHAADDGIATQHEVHLHPAGQAYSSDEAGDGPHIDEMCLQLLRNYPDLFSASECEPTRKICMSGEPIVFDIDPVAIQLLHAATAAQGAPLRSSDIKHLLEHMQATLVRQSLPANCFLNTPGRGYCGYIIVLQVAMLHHCDLAVYPELADMVWRHVLADLPNLIAASPISIADEMEPEKQQLVIKLPYICARRRANAGDNTGFRMTKSSVHSHCYSYPARSGCSTRRSMQHPRNLNRSSR